MLIVEFGALQGDHVTFLNVYKGFLQSGKSSKWCHKNFINYHAMVSTTYSSFLPLLTITLFKYKFKFFIFRIHQLLS